VSDDNAAGGFRVNMSDKEASSVDREPLPPGKYHLKITDMSIERTSTEAKHPNEPYINFEFTVQDGKFSGRKMWANAMCFDGALYTISQILKSLGREINPKGGHVTIPNAREVYIGKDLWGRQGPNKKNLQDDGTGKMVPRLELQGFSKYEGGTSADGAPQHAGVASGNVLP
jgi:hypothetical protein